MNLITLSLLVALISSALLILSPSLPLQALALLTIRITIATILGAIISTLIGIYTVIIYARGLLVLLAYFVALSPNQTLNYPSRLSSLTTASTRALILSQTLPINRYINFSNEGTSNLITILTPALSSLLTVIALILVLTMIAVVKVSRLRRGPIRPWTS